MGFPVSGGCAIYFWRQKRKAMFVNSIIWASLSLWIAFMYARLTIPGVPPGPTTSAQLRTPFVFVSFFIGFGNLFTVYVDTIARDAAKQRLAAERERVESLERKAAAETLLNESLRRENAQTIQRQLLEKTRERLINQLVHNFGHEVRTPLTAVIAYVDMMLNLCFTDTLPEGVAEPLNSISRSARRIDDIVDNYVTIATVELHGVSREICDIDQLINHVVNSESVWTTTRKSQDEVEILYENVDVQAEIDTTSVRRAIRALIQNAIKFNTEGGAVEIRAWKTKNYLRVEVSDTGIGIEVAYLMKIFEPSFQIQHNAVRQYEGSGMGLTMALKVAEAHGGSIEVKSNPIRYGGNGKALPGHGSTFTMVLALGEIDTGVLNS